MLNIIAQTLKSSVTSPEVTPTVTPEVKRLFSNMNKDMTRKEIQAKLNLKDGKNFRLKYLLPAIEQNLVEMTIPEKPNSRLQKYRLTVRGKALKSRSLDSTK